MIDWKPEALIIDNFLTKPDLKDVKFEIKQNRKNFHSENRMKDLSYNRWYPQPGNLIPEVIDKYFFNDDFMKRVENYIDGFWKIFHDKVANGYEVQVTSYKKSRNNMYKWHVDHKPDKAPGFLGVRVLNYILQLNDVSKGGELEIADYYTAGVMKTKRPKVALKVKPKKNRLVMIPSWYVHRVKPMLSDQERLTVNGHIYIQPVKALISGLPEGNY